MPRRRVLTDAQLESLIALRRTEPVLVRHWTLNEADLAAIARRRGGGNRLGYALQLCAFRYPGRALDAVHHRSDVMPDALLAHLAPLGWQHTNLTGDYLWGTDAGVGSDRFRPLRGSNAKQPLVNYR